MTRITITTLSDKGRKYVPNIIANICPHTVEGDKIYVFIEQHGIHSEDDRVWQVGFLFSRFAGELLKENIDFTWVTEPWDNNV